VLHTQQHCTVGCQIIITEHVKGVHLGRRDFQSFGSIVAKGVGNVERKESEKNEGQKKRGKERDTNSGIRRKKEIQKRFEVLTAVIIF